MTPTKYVPGEPHRQGAWRREHANALRDVDRATKRMARRSFLLLISLVIAIAALLVFARLSEDFLRYQGRPVQILPGQVVSKHWEKGPKGKQQYLVTLRLTLNGGDKRETVVRVGRSDWNTLAAGDEVDVRCQSSSAGQHLRVLELIVTGNPR